MEIMKEMRESSHFALMLDETIDCTVTEQLVLREGTLIMQPKRKNNKKKTNICLLSAVPVVPVFCLATQIVVYLTHPSVNVLALLYSPILILYMVDGL